MSVEIKTIIVDEQQLTETEAWLTLDELCERCSVQPALLLDLVGMGLITPEPEESAQWLFRTTTVSTLHQALRLRRELDLDWQGVAVAMDLMEQLRDLRQQVDSLKRQLAIHK